MQQNINPNSESIFTKLVEFLESLAEPFVSIGKTPISFVSLLTCIGFIVLAFIVSAALRRVLSKLYKKRRIEPGTQHALNRLLHYVVISLGIFLAVDNLGISLSALAAVGGVLLVGIGFGLQDLAKDFISGVILLIERPIRKGDFIEVDEFKGSVIEIGLRSTLINTYDDIEILIPNGKLINDVVINRLYQEKHYRIRINVGVAYGSDTERVRDLLIGVAKAHPDILEKPEPIVFFEYFKDSYLDFRLMGWLDNARLEPRVKSDLHYGVDKTFREAGIEIAFPQLDLHFRNDLEKNKH
jgi:small-conductance mechanosensitive channel